MSLLAQIVATKREEIRELRAVRLPEPPPLRPLPLRADSSVFQLICEFKRRSPSAGPLSTTLSIEERVRKYEQGGAAMISVLCDGPFFAGSYADLRAASEHTRLPLLAKEFILDEVQLDQARAFGASAALLIVRCLTPKELARLHAASLERDLVPIVEVTSPEEVQTALEVGAAYVGVNARNLDTLHMDGGRAAEVLSLLPPSCVRLHFSGVKSPEQIQALRRAGLNGALVGESLMRQDDPLPLLQSFVEAARSELDSSSA